MVLQTRYRRYCIDVTIVLVKSYSRVIYIYIIKSKRNGNRGKERRWLNGEIDRVCLYYYIIA